MSVFEKIKGLFTSQGELAQRVAVLEARVAELELSLVSLRRDWFLEQALLSEDAAALFGGEPPWRPEDVIETYALPPQRPHETPGFYN